MEYFDWSKSDKFNINALFNSYVNYVLDTGSIESFLREVSNLVHFVIIIKYSGISSFDREDLIAESIEKVYHVLSRDIGIFNQPMDQLHPVGFCNYIKSIISTAIRGYLDAFPLHLIDIPECEFTCPKCNNTKIIYKDINESYKLLCEECDSSMNLIAIRKSAIPKYLEYSKEHIVDIDSYLATIYDDICIRMIKRNRFNLTESLIKYYVSSRLQHDNILQKCIKSVYNRKHPERDLDNLNFLYKWALSDLYDDYDGDKIKRVVSYEIQ